jgi:ABC-2 type transport system permease protein
MRGTWLIVRRELAAYANSYWGYLVVAVILLVDGLLFNAYAMGDSPRYSADVLELFFRFSFGTTVIAAVLLTMRLIAEERQTGTIVLVDSSPLSDSQIVIGKYLSAMAVLGILILATVYMPALIFVNGRVSVGHIVSGYLGLFLVGSAATAMGTFGSVVSRSQLVAAAIGGVLVVFAIVAWMLATVTEPPFSPIFSYVALFDQHFQPFRRGRVNTESIVYLLSLTFLFLMLSTRWLSARRWR